MIEITIKRTIDKGKEARKGINRGIEASRGRMEEENERMN